MKKSIMLCLVCLCASLLHAQSGNAKFIDSPSWVLQGEGGARTEPAAVPMARPAVASASTSATAKTAKEAPVAKTTSVAKASPREREVPAPTVPGSKSPRKEGFLHLGVYILPGLNWVGNVSDGYKRQGVTGMINPTIMVDMRIIRRLFAGVGVSFSTLGGRLQTEGEVENMGATRRSSYNFQYVEIPFRLKLKTPNFGETKGSLFLSAGASVGFGVNYKFKDVYANANLGNQIGTFIVEGKMKQDAKLANFSIIGQVGYNYQIVKHFNFVIGMEYRYACVDPIKEGGSIKLKDLAFHNHQIGLVLGIMF